MQVIEGQTQFDVLRGAMRLALNELKQVPLDSTSNTTSKACTTSVKKLLVLDYNNQFKIKWAQLLTKSSMELKDSSSIRQQKTMGDLIDEYFKPHVLSLLPASQQYVTQSTRLISLSGTTILCKTSLSSCFTGILLGDVSTCLQVGSLQVWSVPRKRAVTMCEMQLSGPYSVW